MPHSKNRPNKTDAGNGSKAICRVSNVLRSPSPDPMRSAGGVAAQFVDDGLHGMAAVAARRSAEFQLRSISSAGWMTSKDK